MVGKAGQAIITKGLSCGKTRACEGGSLLTAGPFSLFCLPAEQPPVEQPVRKRGHGGAGSIGFQPHVPQPVIPPFRRQYDDEDENIVPLHSNIVKITIKFKDITIVKDYNSKKRTSDMFVLVFSIANKSAGKLETIINSAKKIAQSAKVQINKITRKE